MSEQKKLYLVEYTFTAVVMAEDESDAWAVAHSECRDAFSDSSEIDIFVEREVKGADDLRDGWDLQCIPYGGEGNTRIGEILAGSENNG